MEGRRPLLAEVQALVTAHPRSTSPRRTTSGLDSSRVAMVLAVLQQHCRLRLHNQRRLRLHGRRRPAHRAGHRPGDRDRPGLRVALAGPPPQGIVAIGEIGLAGELRRVRDLPQRLAEAARLGFQLRPGPGRALRRPTGGERTVNGLRVIDVPDIGSALAPARLRRADRGWPPDLSARLTRREPATDPRRLTAQSTARHQEGGGRGQSRALGRSRSGCAPRSRRSRPAPRCATASSGSCAAAPAR